MDCTGCKICVENCPDCALIMNDFREVSAKYNSHWEYSEKLPIRD